MLGLRFKNKSRKRAFGCKGVAVAGLQLQRCIQMICSRGCVTTPRRYGRQSDAAVDVVWEGVQHCLNTATSQMMYPLARDSPG